MNKKQGLFLGFAIILLAAIFTFTGYGDSGGDDNPNPGGNETPAVKGKLTITNIPTTYNGMYISVESRRLNNGKYLYGYSSFSGQPWTMVQILSDGKAEIPLYLLEVTNDKIVDITAYDGNDQGVNFTLFIFKSSGGEELHQSITVSSFASGSATWAWQ